MTHLIPRSHIPDENAFARAVELHAGELSSYETHIAAVNRGEAQYYPPPGAPVDVDLSVRRPDFVPDYLIVDCLPVQQGDINALNQRKNELRHQVAQMEGASINVILPRGKWRFKEIEYQLSASKSLQERTAADLAIIAEQQERNLKVRDVNLHHARLESEIEDLNFDTVNQWVPTPYQ